MTTADVLLFISRASQDDLIGLSAAIKAANRKFPKKVAKPRSAKIPTAEEQARSQAFTDFKAWFLLPKENGGAGFTDFYFDGTQAGGLSMWIKKMVYRYKLRNGDQIPTGGQLFFNMKLMFQNLPPFWADKVDFTTINGKFEVIIQQIAKTLQHEQQSDPLHQARQLNAQRRSQQPNAGTV